MIKQEYDGRGLGIISRAVAETGINPGNVGERISGQGLFDALFCLLARR